MSQFPPISFGMKRNGRELGQGFLIIIPLNALYYDKLSGLKNSPFYGSAFLQINTIFSVTLDNCFGKIMLNYEI
jgi:hypothetical protein